MPYRFAVVCEAKIDFQVASKLAERVISECVEWADAHALENCPLWVESSPIQSFWTWTEVRIEARRFNINARGHFDGKPGGPDAIAARRALLLLALLHKDSPIEAVLLIRDDDRQTERKRGLEQARAEASRKRSTPIVIGISHCKVEAWLLAGYEPIDDREKDMLKSTHQELGSDPRTSAHELTAIHETDKRSAKRVVEILCGHDDDRLERCWAESPLATLRERGEYTGLTAFLDEVLERLVPLFGQRH